ncbi:MAG TPA: helicase-related protein [Parafilimonas sp.]|nr:helicase-related protein [Parafilimonas sp.]
MADLVQSYIDFALDKKMIVYAVNRSHCARIVEKFNSMGYSAKAIDSYTPTDERQKLVEDFKNNKFKILCNVNIFTEGFDCPDVDAVQLARPTKSLVLFLQQVGRCMRPHQNKQYGIILDNAGLWKEHGLPKMDRNWSLNGDDKSLCPSQKEIIGIKEISARKNSEPQESKGIRLIELGELENIAPAKTIDFNNIERNLTDKKIATMRERIEELTSQIQEIKQRIQTEPKEFIKNILGKELKTLQNELSKLQEELQPQRFEQVLGLIIEKCQDVIDSNEIFVDGDKDAFLNRFVEPYLKLNDLKNIQDVINRKPITQNIAQENSTSKESENKVQTKRGPITKLKVIFPNGKIIFHNKAAKTLVNTIVEIGIDKVQSLNLINDGVPLVSNQKDNKYKSSQYEVSHGLYVITHSSTQQKKKLLENISEKFGLGLKIEII